MSGSEGVGEASPLPAASLKPEMGPLPPFLAERTALDELHDNGFDKAELADAVRAEERLARLASDHAEVERLRDAGFEGPGYETLKAALALYGFPVMQAWIRRRQIYGLTASRKRPVTCHESVREHLARDVDDRQQLASEVVVNALVFFRVHALQSGRWTPEGGASLTTFFVGACVSVFPNVFRAWLKEYNVDRNTGHYELDPDLNQPGRHLLDPRISEDPADVVSNMETFRDALNSANSPRLRDAIAEVVLNDSRYAEIAEQAGTSEAAIKQMFHRYHQKRRKEGGRDS